MIWNTRILIAEEVVVEAGQEAVWTQLTERVVHMVILGKKSKLVHIFMLNTSYLTDSDIMFTLKMESQTKNTIFGLKMIVKSGLEKNILKFLHVQN